MMYKKWLLSSKNLIFFIKLINLFICLDYLLVVWLFDNIFYFVCVFVNDGMS